ncbi:hypothetical protein [Hymenobacter sp. GOD-10R]|uniref:hypothetical protein n=1 Tax=Hymenobacter sp. GOD-10R TaxID=3093922 RepID=UPI002D780B1D|nr:hypothetical protein [Hymenobacter sp. GOD-10R]WRQ28904.1 hypothetical protein SD425_01325 [Hymenobacter sp. GOD-10R]
MRYFYLVIPCWHFDRFLTILLLSGGLGLLSYSVRAQTHPAQDGESPFRLLPNYEKVYTYVERMPFFKTEETKVYRHSSRRTDQRYHLVQRDFLWSL